MKWCVWFLLGVILGALVLMGAWWLFPALFAAAPAAVKLHEIKTEEAIDAEGAEKAQQIYAEGGLHTVAERIAELLRRDRK